MWMVEVRARVIEIFVNKIAVFLNLIVESSGRLLQIKQLCYWHSNQ